MSSLDSSLNTLCFGVNVDSLILPFDVGMLSEAGVITFYVVDLGFNIPWSLQNLKLTRFI